MPAMRSATIGATARTSPAARGSTPERAMTKPITVPVKPNSTRLLAT